MAKSDSFFIRAKLNAGGSTPTGFNQYFEEAINLGSYVDALGKSVLRIHNIAVSVTDLNGTSVEITGQEEAAAQFVLTTQSAGSVLPQPSDRSVISSGSILASRTATGNGLAARNYEEFDNLPQLWTNGYLVAVDQIFIGGQASEHWQGDVFFHIVMECTVETMSQAAAMALSLSQQ